MRTLKFIWRNLDAFRFRFLVLVFVSMVEGGITFLIPVFLAKVVDGVNENRSVEQIFVWFYLVVGLYLAYLILAWFVRNFGEAICYKFSHYLRKKFFDRYSKLSLSGLLSGHSGFVLSLINKVADGMTAITTDLIYGLCRVFVNLSFFFYFLILQSWQLALFNFLAICVFLFVSTLLAKRMTPLAKELNLRSASLGESFADFMANALTIKRLGIKNYANAILDQKIGKNYAQIDLVQKFHADRWFILHGIYGVALLTTMGFLIKEVVAGRTGPGILLVFVMSFNFIKGNIERLSENFKAFIEMNAYLDNLDLRLKEVELGGDGKLGRWNKISFKDVVFGHKGSAKRIKISDFYLKKGEKVCVFGKSGQGKSSFLNLFMNFYGVEAGGRFVDKKSFESIGQSFFLVNMCFVSQEVELFNLSLRENLLLGKKMDDDVLMRFLAEIDLKDFVLNLDKGLDTVVGEKGLKLSAGQKQRLNLLRGVLLDKEIVILDEPTSNLDKHTEKKVIMFLKKYLKKKTLIVVSHRPEVEKICNRVYEMKNHSLVEVT